MCNTWRTLLLLYTLTTALVVMYVSLRLCPTAVIEIMRRIYDKYSVVSNVLGDLGIAKFHLSLQHICTTSKVRYINLHML